MTILSRFQSKSGRYELRSRKFARKRFIFRLSSVESAEARYGSAHMGGPEGGCLLWYETGRHRGPCKIFKARLVRIFHKSQSTRGPTGPTT